MIVYMYLIARSRVNSMSGVNNCLSTVVPAKSDSDAMFCLQSDLGLKIDISLVY